MLSAIASCRPLGRADDRRLTFTAADAKHANENAQFHPADMHVGPTVEIGGLWVFVSCEPHEGLRISVATKDNDDTATRYDGTIPVTLLIEGKTVHAS